MYRATRRKEIYQEQENVYEVMSIGMDEDNGGEPYHEGVWCDFTFYNIPSLTEEIKEWVEEINYQGGLLLIDKTDNSIRLKTIEEIKKE